MVQIVEKEVVQTLATSVIVCVFDLEFFSRKAPALTGVHWNRTPPSREEDGFTEEKR